MASWWYSGRSLCLNFAFAIARIALFCKTSIFLTPHLNEDPHAIMPLVRYGYIREKYSILSIFVEKYALHLNNIPTALANLASM